MARQSANEPSKGKEADRIVAAAAPQFDTSPPASGSFEAGKLQGTYGASAAYKAKQAALPSGSPAVSTATASQFMLAVDQAGAVFHSEDSGIHWERVARQWSGRAVAVRVQSTVGANTSAAPSPNVVFEIVNDQGQVWVSRDGRIWKAK
jgi:photosystem II stability/assembly factor-like uncharacterized protein